MIPVEIDAKGVRINGRYTVLLCSSLFYFRIPRELWGDRMEKIKAAGYNAIDVYFPWNFHETHKDRWDFTSGMRNVDSFLELAARRGLYVVARPGPYICSEWDGGALPAYLAAEGIPLRQNDPAFLSRTAEWYRRILPIIAGRQLGGGGTVILVQIENELDFYDCRDVPGYIAALRGMAREAGITAPLIACSGQNDLAASWGGVEGVVPAMNLYLNSRQPDLEDGVAPFRDALARLNHPILVPETGRDVLILRRLFAAGAKLLGSYNQVGGYDFGFTSSVNNWGKPLAFLTTHYDFDSLVGSFGRVRGNAWEDRAFAGLLESVGPSLAGAVPCRDHGIRIETTGELGERGATGLRLLQYGEAGYALPVTNIGGEPLTAEIVRGDERWPKHSRLTVEAASSTFVFFDLSLQPLGLPGIVRFSSAEPFALRGGQNPAIVFQSMGEAEVHYDIGGGEQVFILRGKGIAKDSVRLPDGRTLTLYGIPRRDAMKAAFTGGGAFELREARRPARRVRKPAFRWRLATLEQEALFPPAEAIPDGRTFSMESQGAYRGYALYEIEIPAAAPEGAIGVMLHNAADILSVYLDGRFLGTGIPGGGEAFFALPKARNPRQGSRLAVRAEIWGHSNFDDPRMRAIRIDSLRGFSAATLVTRKDPLSQWTMDPGGRDGRSLPYLSYPGGRLTSELAPRYRSVCTVVPDGAADRFLLWAEKPECPTLVEVDGRPLGWVDRNHDTLDLSRVLEPDRPAKITLVPQKWYAAESTGAMYLVQGVSLGGARFAGAQEMELLASARACVKRASPASLPLSVPKGGVAWLYGSLREDGRYPCHGLALRGCNLKASVFFNGRLVGRLFLDSPLRPKMAGGRDDLAYLPSCWYRAKGNVLEILLESVGGAPGRLVSAEAEPT